MTYYVKDKRTGKVYKGKTDKYRDGMIDFGCVLFNPYSGETVVGWNNYKASMQRSYEKKYGSKTQKK